MALPIGSLKKLFDIFKEAKTLGGVTGVNTMRDAAAYARGVEPQIAKGVADVSSMSPRAQALYNLQYGPKIAGDANLIQRFGGAAANNPIKAIGGLGIVGAVTAPALAGPGRNFIQMVRNYPASFMGPQVASASDIAQYKDVMSPVNQVNRKYQTLTDIINQNYGPDSASAQVDKSLAAGIGQAFNQQVPGYSSGATPNISGAYADAAKQVANTAVADTGSGISGTVPVSGSMAVLPQQIQEQGLPLQAYMGAKDTINAGDQAYLAGLGQLQAQGYAANIQNQAITQHRDAINAMNAQRGQELAAAKAMPPTILTTDKLTAAVHQWKTLSNAARKSLIQSGITNPAQFAAYNDLVAQQMSAGTGGR